MATNDEQIKTQEIVDVLDTEIKWCQDQPTEHLLGHEYRIGFVAGQKQARYLIIQMLATSQLHERYKGG